MKLSPPETLEHIRNTLQKRLDSMRVQIKERAASYGTFIFFSFLVCLGFLGSIGLAGISISTLMLFFLSDLVNYRKKKKEIENVIAYLSTLAEFNALLEKRYELRENIDAISEMVDKIYSFFIILESYKAIKIDDNSTNSNTVVDAYFLRSQYKYFTSILADLRSDLRIELGKQEKILKGAKTEVEEKISGSLELESVSELQQHRLDRQIEQFSLLKRKLVKI